MLVRVLTSSNKTVFRPVQLWNALKPIVVTVLGMDTDVRPVQPLNTETSMLVMLIPGSNKTVIRPAQLWNACTPIVVTVLGMVIPAKTVQL